MTQFTEAQIKLMAERFLSWKLPENFNPDGGISFEPEYKTLDGTARHEPTGTNLLDYTQAEAMVRHMLASQPVTTWSSPTLERAYDAVEKLRADLNQHPESGIDESLRRAMDAIETADTELTGLAA